MRLLRIAIVFVVAAKLLGATVAFAQTGAIAGTVKDTSGAVLPGVTEDDPNPVAPPPGEAPLPKDQLERLNALIASGARLGALARRELYDSGSK